MNSDTNLDRRTILLMGLASGSALLASGTGRAVAQEGVEIKVIRESPSMIPGFAKVQLREARFQPGGKTAANPMKNAMICECSLGSLEVVQDGKTFTAETGFVWTCDKGTVEQSFNKGTTPAVMRIFDLLPA
jgi:hypothetical protein